MDDPVLEKLWTTEEQSQQKIKVPPEPRREAGKGNGDSKIKMG